MLFSTNDRGVLRFVRGDEEAFVRIFREYYPALRLFARKVTGDDQQAEDIAQEALMKFWENAIQFDHPKAIKFWLYTTARHSCLTYIARQKRLVAAWADEAPDGVDDFILAQLVRTEVITQVVAEIERLPPQCKKIFKLIHLEGFTQSEVAGLLGLSVNTIKNQNARGVKIMRQRLKAAKLFLFLSFFQKICD